MFLCDDFTKEIAKIIPSVCVDLQKYCFMFDMHFFFFAMSDMIRAIVLCGMGQSVTRHLNT